MPTVRQHFAGGEVSPEIYGRTDIARYGVSLRTMLNFIATPGGAAKNRPGTLYVSDVRDHTKYTRLVPFVFNSDLSYVLQITPGWMRFINNGIQVWGWEGRHNGGDSKDWMNDGMTDVNRFWVPGSLVGKTLSNFTDLGDFSVIAANTSQNITTVDEPGGTWDDADRYFIQGWNEIPTPWADGDLERLQYAQFNDIMVFVHPAYPPYVLRRYATDSWTLTALSITRPVSPPQITAVSDTGTGGNKRQHTWAATAVDSDGNESLPSYYTPAGPRAIYPGATDTRDSVTIVPPAKGKTPSTYVLYRGEEGVVGYIQDAAIKAGASQDVEDRGNAPDYTDTPPQGRDPFIVTEQSVGIGAPVPRTVDFGAPVAGVSVATKDTTDEAFDSRYEVHWAYDLVGECAATVLIEVDVTGVGDDYKPVWGPVTQYVQSGRYVGEKFKAINIPFPPDIPTGAGLGTLFRMTVTPLYGTQTTTPLRVDWIEQPTAPQAEVTNIYPSAVCFFQQRLVMANFQGPDASEPSTIKTSRIGDIYNFDQSLIAKANDAMVLTLSSLRLDEVRALIPLNSLLCFTAGAEWTVKGVDDAAIGPTNYSLRPNSWYGSSWVVPVVIGRSVIFCTERGRIVRDLQHDPLTGALAQGKDLTVMTRHLFESSGLREWAYAETPHSVLWAVRGDGLLLGMTYEPDHDVWAWSRHTTGPITEEESVTGYRKVTPRDEFESICTVPEVGEDAVYVVVKRTIPGVNGGEPVRYIERLAAREGLGDVADHVFADSAVHYDGRWAARAAADPVLFDGYESTRARVDYSGGGSPTWQVGDSPYLVDWDNPDGDPWLTDPTGAEVGAVVEIVSGDHWVRLEITSMSPAGNGVTCEIESFYNADGGTSVHADLQNAFSAEWAFGYKQFIDFAHLEGETLNVLGDGGVVTPTAVSGNALNFDDHYVRLSAGLPIQADIETLPVSFPQDPGEIRKRNKTVVEVGLELDNWRGLKVGQHLGSLVPIQQRDVRSGYGEVNPARGIVVVRPFNVIEREVAIALRQDDPLPVTILAASIEVDVETEER